MMKRLQLVCVFSFCLACTAFAQQKDTLVKKLDSLSVKTDSAGGQINNTNPKAYNENTQIDFQTYFILLGSDFKQQITKPFHMTGRDWGQVGKFAVVAGALALGDEPIQHFALRQRNSSPTVRNVSKYVTNSGGQYEAITLVALGTYGFLFKNEKIKTTSLLATQSYITSAVIAEGLKLLTHRDRPYRTNPNLINPEPTFHGPFYKRPDSVYSSSLGSSFPSGHTTAAFAAATVYAMEYKNHPIIPILAYSAATLIGVSRITENKHWATDVLTGAALGYLTGRQVVNNYHRYAKLKAPRQKKNTVTFTLQHNYGVWQPGLVYTFR